MNIRNFEDVGVLGKYVLLRDDFNVQIVNGKITDTFRIDESLSTIKKLTDGGARVVICAHFGKPRGLINPELSLAPVAAYLGIKFIPDCLNKDFMPDMKNGDVALLENLRFYPGEELNDENFAKSLASGFDIFVNDAFAVSHRAHASTVGVTKYLPSFAGNLLLSEIRQLNNVTMNPSRPLLVIVGGSKVSSKLNLLKSLVKLADTVIVGGALAITFSYALGGKVGNSLYEPGMKDDALNIIKLARENDCELLLPIDKGTAKEFTPDSFRTNKDFDELCDDDIIMDEGILTTQQNIRAIDAARTVIWNGSLGMAEWAPNWSYGTFSVATAIAEKTKKGNFDSIIGGGDTVAALEFLGVKNDITYVSTGGGAFLEFIEGQNLPGIAALEVI